MFLRRTRRQTHGTVLPDGQCVSVIHWRLWKTPHLFHPCPQESFGFRELIPLMSWPSDPSQAKWKCLPGLESSRLLSFSDQVKVLSFSWKCLCCRGNKERALVSLLFPANISFIFFSLLGLIASDFPEGGQTRAVGGGCAVGCSEKQTRYFLLLGSELPW